jgi:hypothetical protein
MREVSRAASPSANSASSLNVDRTKKAKTKMSAIREEDEKEPKGRGIVSAEEGSAFIRYWFAIGRPVV